MKSNALIVLLLVLGTAFTFSRHARGDDDDQGNQGGFFFGQHAPIATITRGETPYQLLRDAQRDAFLVQALGQVSSGLHAGFVSTITSAATVAKAVDAIALVLSQQAAADTTLAQKLLASKTPFGPGETKVQLLADAAADTSDSITLAQASSVFRQAIATQKGAPLNTVFTFERLSFEAQFLAFAFEEQAQVATFEASRLK